MTAESDFVSKKAIKKQGPLFIINEIPLKS